jgi:putative FmdB family regulatory protein
MPIFEYRCEKCGHVMEVLHKSLKEEKVTCEKCGGFNLRKLFSSFAVGQGKAPESHACDSCSALPACGGGCPGGMCPMS